MPARHLGLIWKFPHIYGSFAAAACTNVTCPELRLRNKPQHIALAAPYFAPYCASHRKVERQQDQTASLRNFTMFRSNNSLRRWLAVTTAFSMAAQLALPAGALADVPAPPARVGQLEGLTGDVSFNAGGSGGWAAAVANYPVAQGDSLYTQDGAQAAISIDSSTLTLAADTELQITGLGELSAAATESQGELFLAINYLQPGQNYTITTPRGTVNIVQNGQYDIQAGDSNTPTVITVFQGAATLTAPGATLQIAANQSGVLSGSDQTVAQLGQPEPDAFAEAMLRQNAPPPPAYAPPVVQQMSGTAELSSYGSWNQNPQYGAVWYPQVEAGWAPYRQGHWVDVQPWGWTWVESEPWGFAPFHYGRWIHVDDRWGWAPAPAYDGGGGYGPDYRPVYAPAVVSFFGLAVAAGITAAALSGGSVGWVPLAPDEPYYPSYRCPPDYVRRINIVNVRNINVVNIHNTTNNYYGGGAQAHFANRDAATYIPADSMRRGDPVARYGHPVPEAAFASARPIDAGFGQHPAGEPGMRLPPAGVPLARLHPGFAPRPSDFAERHNIPPAVISHEQAVHFAGPQAASFHPPEMGPHAMAPGMPDHPGVPDHMDHMAPNGGMMPENRPAMSMNPGFHPPPAPPMHHESMAPLPPAQNFRPATENQPFHPMQQAKPMPEVHYGQPQEFHPQAQTRPMEQPRPEQQEFHPQPQQYHPQPQQFHPEAQQFHPEAQQFHPQAPRPEQPRADAPRPQAPRPEGGPGHEDKKN
jgi:hypothetical protein